MRSPRRASKISEVPLPTRLLSSVMDEARPVESRSTSNTENGRRSSGSRRGDGLIITNWPGATPPAISGAPSVRTLYSSDSRLLSSTSALTSTSM
jgi:hypothetical protein